MPTTAPEQDAHAQITTDDMDILRGLVGTAEAEVAKWKALSRRNEDRLKAANAARDAAREDATKWKRRADHNSAVLGELRRQNANLIARLTAKETH